MFFVLRHIFHILLFCKQFFWATTKKKKEVQVGLNLSLFFFTTFIFLLTLRLQKKKLFLSTKKKKSLNFLNEKPIADYNKQKLERKATQSPASSTRSSFFGGIFTNPIINPFIPNELQNGENENYGTERQQGRINENQFYERNPNQRVNYIEERQNAKHHLG